MWLGLIDTGGAVPNAPCGVERKRVLLDPTPLPQFLMHRVELKVDEEGEHSDGYVCS